MPILQTVCEYLGAEEWAYGLDQAKGLVYFDVAGPAGALACLLVVDEEAECLSLYTQVAVVVPAIKRLRMADFFARVNYLLLLGCFELNVETGEVHFRVALPLADSRLSRQQLRDLISSSILAANRYHPGIMMLIYRNATAVEALQACEAEPEP